MFGFCVKMKFFFIFTWTAKYLQNITTVQRKLCTQFVIMIIVRSTNIERNSKLQYNTRVYFMVFSRHCLNFLRKSNTRVLMSRRVDCRGGYI